LFSVNAGKGEKLLIERAGEFVFARRSGERRPAFIERAREKGVPAEAAARAARRALCEIVRGEAVCRHMGEG
jgi:hypothetical protein